MSRCEATLADGRRCALDRGHRQRRHAGSSYTCECGKVVAGRTPNDGLCGDCAAHMRSVWGPMEPRFT